MGHKSGIGQDAHAISGTTLPNCVATRESLGCDCRVATAVPRAKQRQTRRGPALIADRAYDVDALRAWRARQGMEAVLPARARRMNLQPPP